MTSITGIRETPGQPASSVVSTVGSSATINAKAERVFQIVTDYENYDKWNSWTPSFKFEDGKPMQLGSQGMLTAKMEAQKKDYQVPVKIIAFSTSPDRYVVGWRASLLPSWFSVAERMHVITPTADGQSCEALNYESMSGWGTYIMKWLGIQNQVQEALLKYIKELKDYAESSPE